jgi:hypothetical protein
VAGTPNKATVEVSAPAQEWTPLCIAALAMIAVDEAQAGAR